MLGKRGQVVSDRVSSLVQAAMNRRELGIAYRTGIVSRGRFMRAARAQGWTAVELQAFESEYKQQHKQTRKARG